MPSDDVPVLRNQLVDRLWEAGRICTESVAEAFRVVPRHVFLPGVQPAAAYADEVIATKWQPDGQPISSSSQPAIMAIMLEQLQVQPGQRVLEIGAGTGYNAALLAHLVGPTGAVTTLDIDQDLVDQARRHLDDAGFARVEVVRADGAGGWAANGPYDRIVLTVGAQDLVPAWLDQLAAGGRLVLPLSLRGAQWSVAFERTGDHLVSVSLVGCGFMPLRGALAKPDSVQRLGDEPGVLLRLGGERAVETAAMYAALRQPGAVVGSGVSATRAEVMGGLGLWLAFHEPDAGHLSARGAAVSRRLVPDLFALPGLSVTPVLVGQRALAALVRPDPVGGPQDQGELDVRLFGVDEDDLVRRLVAQLCAWDAAGRPSTNECRIMAQLRGRFDDVQAQIVLDTPSARLYVDWRAAG
ncbi:MAG: methyltransferase, FxLD system [Actinomycetota bacterium]|nr:methyltransferase, FxLD system [Actinomycetota bacterium]